MALVGDSGIFREDDVFEGEICQKSGDIHHLGKRSMGKGKAARERRFADLALLFASISVAFSKGWATPFEGLLLMKTTRFLAGRGVYLVEGRSGVSQTLAGRRGVGSRVLAGFGFRAGISSFRRTVALGLSPW